MNAYATTLRELVERSGKSVTQIAEDGRVDKAYLRKLMTGEKRNPSGLTNIKIMVGLVADPKLRNRDAQLLEYALSMLMSAQLSDAVAGDHIK